MEEYLEDLKRLLEGHADEENAAAMSAYMRHQFDFYGIKQPLRKQLTKQFLKEKRYPDIEEMPELLELIWSEPQRELQYIGLDILEKVAKKMPEQAINLYKELITTASWWDTVDMLATKAVGGHLLRFPHLTAATNHAFLNSKNKWLNRTAIIFQLKYKSKTDTNLLTDNIHYLANHDDFFIKKAIGWALREYSKTDAFFVKDFVANNELSTLSKKEALKWIYKNQEN